MGTRLSDTEIEAGWNYAKTSRPADNFVGVITDKNLLRAIGNEARERWKPKMLFPALVGEVCRKYLRERNVTEERTYEAYLCGVMKMFADRRARSNKAKTAKKNAAKQVRLPREVYAESQSGQFLMPLDRPRGSITRTSRNK